MCYTETVELHKTHESFSHMVKPWVSFFSGLARFLTSMELAIVLLIAIAAACVAGSLIPQETLMSLGELQAKTGDAYPYFAEMGLLNVFYSPWFLILLALFFVSVTFGSFRWLRPAWLSIRQKPLFSAQNLLDTAKPNAWMYRLRCPPRRFSRRWRLP
jgi:hypothetical protein